MKANDLQHVARVYQISHRLAHLLGQDVAMDAPEFLVKSSTREGVEYPMVVTPEGIAVHVGDGCEAEFFHMDVMKCRHSKEGSSVMTQLTPYQAPSSPVEITFSDEQMKVITATIAKGASPEELNLFVATCKRTGLDPFLKQIYAVKRWDAKEQREVMAIQVGIDGLRLIAERTGKYGGQDPIEWLDVDGVWSEVWTARGDFPVAARTAVYRKDWTQKAPAVCRWDSYAQYFGKEKKLSPTWDKMPDVMLGKCAEALALRRAFPAEMSGMAAAIDADYDPSADAELQQASTWTPAPDAIEGEVVQLENVQAPPRPSPRPPEHEEPSDLHDRFWAKVNKDGPIPEYRPELGPCWLWKDAPNSDGYGLFYPTRDKAVRAHRFALEEDLGRPLGEGMVPDHLCRVRLCTRPTHLEEVTSAENTLRGESNAAQNASKTHCINGHPLTPDNLVKTSRNERRCLICSREVQRGPQQAPANVSAGTPASPGGVATSAAPSVATCDHRDASYNEQTTMLTCNTCGVVLEEPPADTPRQRSLVK